MIQITTAAALGLTRAAHNAEEAEAPLLRIEPKPVFELSPWLYMQFMEPLGVTDGVTYDSCEVALAPGEMITLFTDGISEALNPANELYTLERLQQKVGMPADNVTVARLDPSIWPRNSWVMGNSSTPTRS